VDDPANADRQGDIERLVKKTAEDAHPSPKREEIRVFVEPNYHDDSYEFAHHVQTIATGTCGGWVTIHSPADGSDHMASPLLSDTAISEPRFTGRISHRGRSSVI
jgi:hypothetical protein